MKISQPHLQAHSHTVSPYIHDPALHLEPALFPNRSQMFVTEQFCYISRTPAQPFNSFEDKPPTIRFWTPSSKMLVSLKVILFAAAAAAAARGLPEYASNTYDYVSVSETSVHNFYPG